MRSRADLEAEQIRANEAKHLMNHHLIKDAFEYIEKVCTEALVHGKDEEKRLMCLRVMDAQKLFKYFFETVMTTGRLADNEIANLVRAERGRKKYE